MDAVIYARYSSDNQREESIDAQVRAISEYAAKEGIKIVGVYADEAKSATTDQRPQFLNMMRDAEFGTFQAVIVHKLDRFSRDRYDSAYYKRHLKKHGVQLLSVLENLDDSPESIILESVLEGMAEYYSKNLAREVMKGMKETAYQCKHTGGTPPLGYDVAPDKSYVVNEQEAEAVRLIFEMYADGKGYNAIIDALNANGYTTKNGNKFGKNSIHDLLTNEKYTGTFVFNKSSSKTNGKRNNHKTKSDDEVIKVPGGCPAIISQELWNRVKSKMETNKMAAGSYSAKAVYVLSGRIFCGKCGSAMTGKRARMGRNKTDYSYYECSTRKAKRACDMKPINKTLVEKAVIDALYDNLFCDDVIDAVSEKIYNYQIASSHEIPSAIKKYEDQLRAVEIEISNIVNAIAKGMYHESMKEKMDELEASKHRIKISLNEAKTQLQTHSLTKEQIRMFLDKYKNIREMAPEAQRSAIQLFVERVTVYDDNINIRIVMTSGNGGASVKKNTTASEAADSCTLLVEANRDTPRFNCNPLSVTVKINIANYRHNK